MEPWIQTRSGKQMWLDRLCPDAVNICEIAKVLSRIPRFGGHTLEWYSVADHSVRVSEIVDEKLKLAALLHDAHEAYTGFGDVCSPAKSLVPEVHKVEATVDLSIAEAFALNAETFKSPEIQRADLVMLATEKRDLMAPQPALWNELPGPLLTRIVPRSMIEAELAFLEAFMDATSWVD